MAGMAFCQPGGRKKVMKMLYNIITFGISTILICYGFWYCKKKKIKLINEERKELSGKTTIICFWMILLFAVLCRLYKFGEFPFLNQDSAMAAVDAKALWLYGTDRFGTRYPVHFYAWGYGQMSSLMSYMMIPLFILFGYSEITIRLPILIASLGGVVAFYFLVKDLYGNMAGIAGMFVVAINPWHFVQSRWALDANLFPHFIVIALALLVHSVKSGKKRYLYISMIFWGLTHYCYGISVYTIPIILLASCIYLCCEKFVSVKDVIISVIIYVAIAWPFFVCMLINTFGWSTIDTPFFTIQNFPNSRRSYDILFFAQDKGSQFLINIKAIYRTIILQQMNTVWDGVGRFGHMGWCLTPFAVSGIYLVIKKIKIPNRDRSLFVLVSIYSIVALCSGIITANVNANRINIFMYAFMFLIISGICQLLMIDYKKSVCVGIMSFGMFILFYHTYFTSYVEEFKKPDTVNYNFKCALETINPDAYDIIYLTPDFQGIGTDEVVKIETIYIYDLDIPYIQGKSSINHGKETVPYKEKYQYVRAFELGEINPDINAAYIISVEDEKLFDDDKFEKKNYGPFMAVY